MTRTDVVKKALSEIHSGDRGGGRLVKDKTPRQELARAFRSAFEEAKTRKAAPAAKSAGTPSPDEMVARVLAENVLRFLNSGGDK